MGKDESIISIFFNTIFAIIFLIIVFFIDYWKKIFIIAIIAAPIAGIIQGNYSIAFFIIGIGVFGFVMKIADEKFGNGGAAIAYFIMMFLVIVFKSFYDDHKKAIPQYQSYIHKYDQPKETSIPKIDAFGIKTANVNNEGNSSTITTSNKNSSTNEGLPSKFKDQNIEKSKIPKVDVLNFNASLSVSSVPIYNPEHYIGIYNTGYAAYLLIDSIKPMKCTVKAIGEGNTYYIYYDFSFVNNEWHFHNSQGFDGLVTDETPIEKNIINFCKSIDWKPVKTQNINSLYDDSNDLQAAKNKLQEFHINITNKLYRQAYDCLSEAFQKKVPFDGWVKGFNTTVSSTPYNITILPESNNESVVLTYELKAVDNPGGTTYYNGTATLINTPLGWKIDRIKNKLQ